MMAFFKENGETSRKQTEIPAPKNRHDYSKGLDATLQRQQLADIARTQSLRLGVCKSKNKGTTGTPLFDPQPVQAKLF